MKHKDLGVVVEADVPRAARPLVESLRAAGVPHNMASYREGAFSLIVRLPGKYLEIDFLDDGVEIEVFASSGKIEDQSSLGQLLIGLGARGMMSGLLAAGRSGRDDNAGLCLQIEGPPVKVSFALNTEEERNHALEFLTHFDREAHNNENWEINLGTPSGSIAALVLKECDERVFLRIARDTPDDAMLYTFAGEDFRELANCLGDLIMNVKK